MWTALCLATLACATTKPQQVVEQSPGVLEVLKDQASLASDNVQLILRYNPCQCACPPFEVQLGGRWVRAELEDLDDPQSAAVRLIGRARTDHNSGLFSEYSTPGSVKIANRRCDVGVVYAVVSVEETE